MKVAPLALILFASACGRERTDCPTCGTAVISAIGEPATILPPLVDETVGRDIGDQIFMIGRSHSLIRIMCQNRSGWFRSRMSRIVKTAAPRNARLPIIPTKPPIPTPAPARTLPRMFEPHPTRVRIK